MQEELKPEDIEAMQADPDELGLIENFSSFSGQSSTAFSSKEGNSTTSSVPSASTSTSSSEPPATASTSTATSGSTSGGPLLAAKSSAAKVTICCVFLFKKLHRKNN